MLGETVKKDMKKTARNKELFRLEVCTARVHEMQLIILRHVQTRC